MLSSDFIPVNEFPLIALTSVTALGSLTGKLGQEMVERPPSDLVYFYNDFPPLTVL